MASMPLPALNRVQSSTGPTSPLARVPTSSIPEMPNAPPPAMLERQRTNSTSSRASDDTECTSCSVSCGDAVRDEQPQLGPVVSRLVAGPSRIIPRLKRRGLFATLSVVPEIEDPFQYSRLTKKMITLVVAIAAAAAPMASAILFPALAEISTELNANQTTTNLSVALYMLGMAIFPLWWSSFAERVGYRTIFLISFMLYIVSNVCCAVSVNIGMFIAFRVASGASAASAQTIGAGVISSVWEVRERGRAMGYFYLGPLMGPLLSPIIGGALTQKFGWRSTMWFLTAFGAVVAVGIIFFLPETLREPKNNRPLLSEKQMLEKGDLEASGANEGVRGLQRTLSKVSTKTRRKVSQSVVTIKVLFVDPLRSLLYLRFPPVLITVYWASLAFGALYMLNVSVQKNFAKEPYNFQTIIIGLLYIPNSIGYVLASVLGGSWNDLIMRRAALNRRASSDTPDSDEPLEYLPEDRMGINAYIAGIVFPLALLWYGWTVQNGVFWFVPMMATFTFGFASMLVFSVATTMLTEFVPGRSASAVAVNNCKPSPPHPPLFVRNICACIGGIIAEPVIQAIGNGWLFTILCFVGILSCSVVWVMQKYGPRWREQAQHGEYKFL
ncbi:major facilitator superfamily domain-containing protein [Tricharina praecox]|uniref:major facilitator superfamily domain-containing protein n=1 Tax=Tricharina praecox TaxID=43433 RepID=UPI002220D75F|nr:major facilitator superfamily domain-containing protein [Tricharina praecox]KAI5857861.1 major facilitator superfamily domain-containing protein [Tricharina praecox]